MASMVPAFSFATPRTLESPRVFVAPVETKAREVRIHGKTIGCMFKKSRSAA